MKFDISVFVDLVNKESDRRLLYGSPNYNDQHLSKSCPLSPGCKTKFCSLDSFFRACIGIGKKTKIVGYSKTKKSIHRPEFCNKCRQLSASKKGELVIDLAEYRIEIDESLVKKYMEAKDENTPCV